MNETWVVEAIDRQTEATTVRDYATFGTYEEARAFADRHELEARACGWTWVVRFRARWLTRSESARLNGRGRRRVS
jgi:hypothetical protein